MMWNFCDRGEVSAVSLNLWLNFSSAVGFRRRRSMETLSTVRGQPVRCPSSIITMLLCLVGLASLKLR